MNFRPLMSSLAISGVFVAAFAVMQSPASAQSALSSCNPATGLSANGQPCVELTPLDPSRISDVSPGADGGDRYGRLDTTTLGQTYACRQIDSRTGGGQGGSLLIEDCGTPLTSAELGELKPFYGTTGAVAPPPPPPPPPVAVAPPPPPPPPPLPAYVPPPPPVAVAAPAVGLGNAGLVAAGVGAAALIGIAIVALDDDDDSSSSTTSTQ